MDEDLADPGLIPASRSSAWSTLWAILGVGLPLTFFAECRSASMYLAYSEFVPLYATEWLCLAAIGVCTAALFALVNAIALKLNLRRAGEVAARMGFGVVVVTAVVVGTQAWVESFGFGVLVLKEWHILIVVAALAAAIEAYLQIFPVILDRLCAIALPASLIGALSLLPLSWVHQSAVPAAREASATRSTIPTASSKSTRANIVLISIDALSASHLTPYGYSQITSPNLFALASRSMVFDRFYAASNFTTTSVATVLTGQMPWSHRALQLLGQPMQESIGQSLPARLHAAGYRTAYFSSNVWAGARRQGFADYFDYRNSGVEWETAPCFDVLAHRFPYICAASANPFLSIVFKAAVGMASATGLIDPMAFADPAPLTEAAERYLEKSAPQPLFLWVHYLPPHDPYAAPAPWLGRFDTSPLARTSASSHPNYLFTAASQATIMTNVLGARYDESVAYVDFYVGKLITTVRKTLGPNTAFLVTADHGESFGHSYGGHGGPMLYEDLIHIPLILHIPEGEQQMVHRTELAEQADLAPTIADITGIAPSPAWEGKSLVKHGKDGEGRTIFAMNFEQNRANERLATGSVTALKGPWKLTVFKGHLRYPEMPVLKTQMYDIVRDPGELTNIANDRPEVAAALTHEIDNHLEVYGGPRDR